MRMLRVWEVCGAKPLIGLALLLASLIAAGGCGAPALDPPRLVLLYAPCTVNKFLLSPYDPDISYTPNLQRFAERAVTFNAHRTEAGSSGIAYASLLTGAQADRHGVFQHPMALAEDLHLIAESYAEHGYETFYWNGQQMAGIHLGYGQGVDDGNRFTAPLLGGDPRFLAILERLRRDPDYRAFVMTNFTVTHGPYKERHIESFQRQYPSEAIEPAGREFRSYVKKYRNHHLALAYNPGPTLERLQLSDDIQDFASAVELLYRANLNLLDRLFGAVVDAVDRNGLRDESLIIFTADHGEIMYRENALFPWTHSSVLAPEVIEVPLLISWPGAGIQPGAVEGVSRSIDVYPTMAELSGWTVGTDVGVDGQSLVAALRSPQLDTKLLAWSHTSVLPDVIVRHMKKPGAEDTWGLRARYYPTQDVAYVWASVRKGDRVYKLRNLDGTVWGYEAFDLAADPIEANNLFDAENPEHREMARQLDRYKAHLVERARAFDISRGEALPREAEQEKLLRELGYIK